ncbi:MAG: hypothetical protein AB7E52_04680 [Bdellovibrionales bacterium]
MKKNSTLFLCCAVVVMTLGPCVCMAQGTSSTTYSRIGDNLEVSRFAKAIEDLPLMPGLGVVEDKDMLFIFGSSRIAQTTLKGGVDIDRVYYFYQATLPQLGWKEITPKLYERSGERLHMKASSANRDGMTYVQFEVEPLTDPGQN